MTFTGMLALISPTLMPQSIPIPPSSPLQQHQHQQPQLVETAAPKPVVMEFAVPDGCSAGDVVQVRLPRRNKSALRRHGGGSGAVSKFLLVHPMCAGENSVESQSVYFNYVCRRMNHTQTHAVPTQMPAQPSGRTFL